MGKIVTGLVIAASLLALSACTDAYEERGLCSYFGACTFGGAEHFDIDYSKDLGSYSSPGDPTEYTISGKPTGATLGGGGKTEDKSSGGADTNSDDSQ